MVYFCEENGEWKHDPAELPWGGVLALKRFSPEQGSILLRFISAGEMQGSGREVLVIEVSQKFLIPFLAFGSIFIIAGTLIAGWRRFGENLRWRKKSNNID